MSGVHSRALAVPARAELEQKLEDTQLELRDMKRERDELEARLRLALEEREEDEPGRDPLPARASPSLPRESTGVPARQAYTVSGIPHSTSLAPDVRIEDGVPARAPSRRRASPDLSRLVVSTFPPAEIQNASPRNPERRTPARRACEFDVEFLGDTHFMTGLTQDISEGGVFVATYQILPIGTVVSLAFDLPSGHRVEARGEVRWARGESQDADCRPGLGIAFTELGPEALARIVEYCGSTPAHYYEF